TVARSARAPSPPRSTSSAEPRPLPGGGNASNRHRPSLPGVLGREFACILKFRVPLRRLVRLARLFVEPHQSLQCLDLPRLSRTSGDSVFVPPHPLIAPEQ